MCHGQGPAAEGMEHKICCFESFLRQYLVEDVPQPRPRWPAAGPRAASECGARWDGVAHATVRTSTCQDSRSNLISSIVLHFCSYIAAAGWGRRRSFIWSHTSRRKTQITPMGHSRRPQWLCRHGRWFVSQVWSTEQNCSIISSCSPWDDNLS